MVVELNRNSDNTIPNEQPSVIAMSFYYACLEFFSSENGKKEFEEYIEKQNRMSEKSAA